MSTDKLAHEVSRLADAFERLADTAQKALELHAPPRVRSAETRPILRDEWNYLAQRAVEILNAVKVSEDNAPNYAKAQEEEPTQLPLPGLTQGESK